MTPRVTEEEKSAFITACRQSMENMGFSPACQVVYVEGPMYDTIRVWRNRSDRHSGDYPNGEFEFRNFRNAKDASAAVDGIIAKAKGDNADDVNWAALITPENGIEKIYHA